MRPRLLPMTTVAAAILLATKGIGLTLGLLPGSAVVAVANAAPAPETHHAAPAPGPVVPVALAAAVPRAPSSPPAPVVSEAERQLLQDLRARRTELETREHTLGEREGVLAAAEQRLDARVGQLTALQTRLEQLDHERLDREAANWAGLVKVYETMKPREAATIFNEMDTPVLLAVLDRMKDTKAAAVLAAMQPDRARTATAQLAVQRTRAITVPAG